MLGFRVEHRLSWAKTLSIITVGFLYTKWNLDAAECHNSDNRSCKGIAPKP